MIFEGKVIQTGTFKKPASKFASRAFDVAKNADKATHLRLKDGKTFVEINKDLIIKRKKNADGNPVNEVVHYTQINSREEFVCVIKGVESVIDGRFYSQIVFMKPGEKGAYLKCDDGVYIHKSEIQVPAFAKVSLNENTTLNEPINQGQFYVQMEEVVLPDGTKVTLPDSRVERRGEEWFFLKNNEWVKCDYQKTVDNRKNVRYLLLDNDKVVNIQKLKTKPNGDCVLEDVNGQDIVVGKKEVKLEQAFVEGSTMEPSKTSIVSKVELKKSPKVIREDNQVELEWEQSNEDGLVKIVVNKYRTKAVYIYQDGHKEVYALHHINVTDLNPNDKLITVGKIDVVDIDEDGIKIEFLDKSKAIAQDVNFLAGKLNSCTINDHRITNIKWSETDDYPLLESYTFDDILLTDIEWSAGEIKSCTVHLFDEEYRPYAVEVKNLRTSKYKHLAITYKLTDELEDVKVDGDKISFKLGDYKFTDAEIDLSNANGKIGKCKLKYKGKEEEIDLRTDSRFEQLRLMVNIALDEQKVTPLVQSKLLNKNGDKYELAADVVLTEEIKEKFDPQNNKLLSGGVGKAKELESVADALKQQEKFKQNPFKTVVIDDKDGNKVHTISDFTTTYEGAADFEISNDIIDNIIGKRDVVVKKGELEVDAKDDKELTLGMATVAAKWLSNPFTFVFGLGAAVTLLVALPTLPIIRKVKKEQLKRKNPDKLKREIQDNVATIGAKNINKLVKECSGELQACKSLYSQEIYEKKSREILAKFRHSYQQEICKMQIVGGGTFTTNFDPNEKLKLIPSSHLAYVEYLRKRKIFENGKEDSSRLKAELKQLKSITGDELIDKKVAVLQEFGGRDNQIKAHNLQMKNIDYFLKKENQRRTVNGLKEISKDNFVKELNIAYYESMSKWGSISDKIEAFKHTEEYMKYENVPGGRKKMKELVDEKRKSLEKQAQSLKPGTIDFDERVDRNGKPVAEGYTQSLSSYFEYVEHLFMTGETKIKKKFSFDFYKKLDEEHKSKYTPTNLADASVRRVNTTDNRKMAFDQTKAQKITKQIADTQISLNDKLATLVSEVDASVNNLGYEDLVKLQLQKQSKISSLKKAYSYSGSDKFMDIIPFAELDESAVNQIKQTAYAASIKLETVNLKIQHAKQQKEAEYRNQVKSWARQEFAQRHNKAYVEFVDKNYKKVTKTGKVVVTAEASVIETSFVEYMKQTTDNDKITRELDVLEVKNNVEESVTAELYCEEYLDDYKAFIEERNAQSTTGQLDPNSEIAKCYFYQHCQRTKAKNVSDFKLLKADSCKTKLKDRLQSGLWPKREKSKVDVKKSSNELKTAKGRVVGRSQSAGLTA